MSSKEILAKVNDAIHRIEYPSTPVGLYEPIEYVLSLGGKRIRPVFMLMAYCLYKEDVDNIMDAAIGIETYHNFTLLHDDLMDNADVRRGMPTVHKKWDVNTAIKSGDTMFMLATQFINNVKITGSRAALELFIKTSLEIYEGQQFDINFETRNDVKIDEYMEMIRLKTSVLIACAIKMGAIYGGATDDDADILYKFGEKIGLAFQLQDDYLDVYGDPKTFGKRIGGDILCNKKTFLLINAINLADENTHKELYYFLNGANILPEDKIKGVTEIYNKLHIDKLCRQREDALFDEAYALLDKISVAADKREKLWKFVENLRYRSV